MFEGDDEREVVGAAAAEDPFLAEELRVHAIDDAELPGSRSGCGVDPSEQTAEWIATHRWNQLIWRAVDWALLMAVLIHSALGMRTVILDYVHGPRARIFTLSALYLLTAILFVLGTIVVATLQPKAGVQ